MVNNQSNFKNRSWPPQKFSSIGISRKFEKSSEKWRRKNVTFPEFHKGGTFETNSSCELEEGRHRTQDGGGEGVQQWAVFALRAEAAHLEGADDEHHEIGDQGHQVLQARRPVRREVHPEVPPDFKIPGLYVIDSIVRQSRHQARKNSCPFHSSRPSYFSAQFRWPRVVKVNFKMEPSLVQVP